MSRLHKTNLYSTDNPTPVMSGRGDLFSCYYIHKKVYETKKVFSFVLHLRLQGKKISKVKLRMKIFTPFQYPLISSKGNFSEQEQGLRMVPLIPSKRRLIFKWRFRHLRNNNK